MTTILQNTRPVDASGFELPSWLNPFYAIPNDSGDIPEAADFDVEPDWDAAFEIPTEADLAWAAREFNAVDGPSDADWTEYGLWSEWQDRLELAHRMDQVCDDDVTLLTGCAG